MQHGDGDTAFDEEDSYGYNVYKMEAMQSKEGPRKLNATTSFNG